jgi:polyisoprenoid-binding protein YceI
MSLRTIFCASLCTALAVPAAFAQQRVNAVDLTKSEIRFVSKQMNVPVEGRFRKFSARIDFDPAKLAESQAQVEVELGSIDTGSTEADTEVKTKGWFNVAAFPKATFVSSSVKALGPNRYEVAGKLAIKGRSADVTMPFTTRQDGGNTVFEGSFSLLRLQYNIGEGPWSDEDTVANAVQVRVRLVGVNKKP